jgi:hypothetical protein
MLSAGDTFVGPTPPSFKFDHLFIVLAVEESSPRQALFVNVTSKQTGCDETCLLNIGDHPFITHASVINYGDAVLADADKLEQAIRQNTFRAHKAVSESLLKKIQNGARTSDAFPPKYLDYLPAADSD